MKSHLFLAIFIVLAGTSCQRVNVVEVEPAQTIEGTYRATFYDYGSATGGEVAYPINGQELTLQIKRVSADSVSVQFTPSVATTPLPSYIYSPAQPMFYAKVLVESPQKTSSYVYLAGKQSGGISTTNPQIWLYGGKKIADYVFTPVQTPYISRIIRFQKD